MIGKLIDFAESRQASLFSPEKSFEQGIGRVQKHDSGFAEVKEKMARVLIRMARCLLIDPECAEDVTA